MLHEVKTTSEIFPVHLWPLQSITAKIPVSPRASMALWSHLEFLPTKGRLSLHLGTLSAFVKVHTLSLT